MGYFSPNPRSPQQSGKRPDRRAGLTPLEGEYDEELEKGFWPQYRTELLTCLLTGSVSLVFLTLLILQMVASTGVANFLGPVFPMIGGMFLVALVASVVLPGRWYIHYKRMIEIYDTDEREQPDSDSRSSDEQDREKEVVLDDSQTKWPSDDAAEQREPAPSVVDADQS